MKLLIIIGDAEPGSGGVADHARLLALECIKSGVETALFALRDRHVSKREEYGSVGDPVTVRVPAVWKEDARTRHLTDFVRNWNPDAINLHWVPHAYHPKGLPIRLPLRLSSALKEKPVHIYFHEIWVDPQLRNPKHWLYSKIQKSCLRSLISSLSVSTISTSNSAWAERLQKCGFQAEILPLFGNFPVHQPTDLSWWDENGIPVNDSDFRVGFLGTFYPDYSPEPIIRSLSEAARKENKRLMLFHAGNIAPHAIENLEKIIHRLEKSAALTHFGYLDPNEISNYFSGLNAVITTIASSLLPKSSNAITVLEHGLPLIICDPTPMDCMQLPFPEHRSRLVISPGSQKEPLSLDQIRSRRSRPYSLLPDYTDRFLGQLKQGQPASSSINP